MQQRKVPARREAVADGPGQMLAEGTEAEIRAIVVRTGGKPVRGQKLGGGRLLVHIALPPAEVVAPPPAGTGIRWWHGRSWKFWTPIAAGATLALGMALWAAVIVMKAIIAALVLIATMTLGAIVLLGFAALLGSVRGGGTWTGSGKWSS